MSPLADKFSLYETLRLVIPGFFIAANEVSAFRDFVVFFDSNSIAIDGVFFVVVALVQGGLIYSLDIPKVFNFFQKDLPTRKIQLRHPGIKYTKILSSYYNFYDQLSAELKAKQEVYSGIYHFLINIGFACLISLFFYIPNCRIDWIILNFSIGVLSTLTALIVYFRRMKPSFKRHSEKYFKSKNYKSLIS